MTNDLFLPLDKVHAALQELKSVCSIRDTIFRYGCTLLIIQVSNQQTRHVPVLYSDISIVRLTANNAKVKIT